MVLTDLICFVSGCVCVQLSRLSLHQMEVDKPAEVLPQLTMQQIADEISSEEELRMQITQLEEQLKQMKPNLAAIAEYRKKVRHLHHMKTKVDIDLIKSIFIVMTVLMTNSLIFVDHMKTVSKILLTLLTRGIFL